MTREEAVEYGLRWKNAICDRGDTEWSEAIQFLNMAIEALRQEPICCKDCKHKEWFETGKIYCCELQDKPAEVKDMDYCSWGEKCDEALDGGDEK